MPTNCRPYVVAQGLMSILRTAESGSVWVIENGQSPSEVCLPNCRSLRRLYKNNFVVANDVARIPTKGRPIREVCDNTRTGLMSCAWSPLLCSVGHACFRYCGSGGCGTELEASWRGALMDDSRLKSASAAKILTVALVNCFEHCHWLRNKYFSIIVCAQVFSLKIRNSLEFNEQVFEKREWDITNS